MECKKTIDLRKFSHEALEQIRISAVARVEAGESPETVAHGIGVNRRQIYRWLLAYHYGGADALKAKPVPGAPPKLGSKQVAALLRIIQTQSPLQCRFEFALWTLAMIRELIRQEFGVALSEVSVGRLMRRLGYSPQRPLYRAWQQDPVLVEHWRATEYPRIAARAKREGALVFFADESGIRSDYHAGTTWSPVGKTPIVKATGARFGFNMLSAVNAAGAFRFMTVEGTVNGAVFCQFLERLIVGQTRKVFLIVDGHPSHKAKVVKSFVEARADRLELFFLPPYSPDLNPDELVWNHVKARVAKATVQTKDEMKAAVYRALHRLQKLPHLVASFFRAPTYTYAAL